MALPPEKEAATKELIESSQEHGISTEDTKSKLIESLDALSLFKEQIFEHHHRIERIKRKEEKLREFTEVLDKVVGNLRNNLEKAKQETEAMCKEFTVLGEVLDGHLITISTRPTKKPKLQEDAGSSIEKVIYVEDSSDGRPPHSPEHT